MAGEDISQHDSVGTASESRGSMRLLACCAATAALGGSLWASLGGGSCGGCRQAAAMLLGIPLAWAGVVFYAALAAAVGWGGLSRWTRAGFYAASGVHVVLLTLLARERVFCGACVIAGTAALAGGALCLAVRPRAGRWAAAVFAAAALATLGGNMILRAVQAQHRTQLEDQLQRGARPVETGRVRLVVYEREGCKHCVQFEEEVLPRLQAALGGALEVERLEPTVTMETPTIEVHGKEVRVFVGPTDYEELESAVRAVR
jgi:hypothetical protein